MMLTAVFLLSFSTLALEVLLTRYFSITQWNHLSFMVISMVLFGFAASGTFLNVLDARRPGWEKRYCEPVPVAAVLVLYGIFSIGAFAVLHRIPLDYFRLPVEPVQALYLLAVYVLLTLPFFFAGFILTLAYAAVPQKTGLVYFISMAGSAGGALLPVLLLPFFGEGALIVVTALVPVAAAPFAALGPAGGPYLARSRGRARGPAMLVAFFGLALVAGAALMTGGGGLVRVAPSEYKALSQLLEQPDTRITATSNGILGRVDTVESPYVRFAPGLSLKYTAGLPAQRVILRDGDSPLVLFDVTASGALRFTDAVLVKSAYLLAREPRDVLLVISGSGGLSIPCALAAGAPNIVVFHRHPETARIVGNHYRIPVSTQNPRAFLRRSDRRFGVIQIEDWGASLPGSAALTQEYLLTIDAFTEYLGRLTDDGVLVLSRKLLLPPADSIRLWAAAYESLGAAGFREPDKHIAVLRNYNTFVLLVSIRPLTEPGVLAEFARTRNFDIVFLEGMPRDASNRYNVFDAPFHHDEIERLHQAYRSGTRAAYFENYPLDVAPQTDRRPFPGRFLKWERLKTLYKAMGSRLYSLFMSGEIVVGVVFFEGLIASAILLALPLLLIPRKDLNPSRAQIVYFLAVGAGFIFVELFFIKAYVFVFGDPVVSFTFVLTVVLLFSGVGGYGSRNLGPGGLRKAFFPLIAVQVLAVLGLDAYVHRIVELSPALRVAAAGLLLAPIGVLLGLAFPLGMRHLPSSPGQRAYAWAANGCASVLAATASAQIALSAGIPAVGACAVAAYVTAFFSLSRIR